MVVFAQLTPATVVFMAALLLVSGILLFRSQRYFARQSQSEPPSAQIRRQRKEPAGRADSPGGMGEWEVQMYETARELFARLDSKMGALQQLIREADRAAARLEAAIAGAGQAAGQPPTPSAAAQPGPSATRAAQRLDPAASNQAGALKSPPGPDSSAAPAADCSDAIQERSGGHRYEEIYTLADYGFAPAEIAQRVGSPIGEVELILSLRDKR